jgi:hypothetical protein
VSGEFRVAKLGPNATDKSPERHTLTFSVFVL